MKKVENHLILNITRMGDIIQSAPLLTNLKKKGVKISYLLLSNFKETATLIPEIDEIIELDFSSLLEAIDRFDFATAFNYFKYFEEDLLKIKFKKLYNLSFSKLSAYLSYFINSDYKKGLIFKRSNEFVANDNWSRFFLSIVDYREFSPFNLVDIYSMIGSANSGNIFIERIDNKESLKIGFVMGASSYDRRWSPENFAILAEKILKEFPLSRIILFGTKSEKELGERFFKYFKFDKGNIVDLIGKTTVKELAEEIKNIDILITNDTGTMHLAWYFGKRVIELSLGPALYNTTGPYGDGHIVVQPEIDCVPCSYKTKCKTLHCHKLISADVVMQCLRFLLKEERNFSSCNNVKILETYFDRKGFLSFKLIHGKKTKDIELRELLKDIWIDTLEKCLKKNEKYIINREARFYLIYKYISNIKKIIENCLNYIEKNRIDDVEGSIELLYNIDYELRNLIYSNYKELIPFYKYFEFSKNLLSETDLKYNLKSLKYLYDILLWQIKMLEYKNLNGGEYESLS